LGLILRLFGGGLDIAVILRSCAGEVVEETLNYKQRAKDKTLLIRKTHRQVREGCASETMQVF
jgi:hypothetical protein